MYYPSSENKGADQLRGFREADLRLCFRICRLLVFSLGGSFNWQRRISTYVYFKHGFKCFIENIVKKKAMIRKWCNQKEITTAKTEVGKTKLTYSTGTYTEKTYSKPSEQLLPNWRPLRYPNLTNIRCNQHKN